MQLGVRNQSLIMLFLFKHKTCVHDITMNVILSIFIKEHYWNYQNLLEDFLGTSRSDYHTQEILVFWSDSFQIFFSHWMKALSRKYKLCFLASENMCELLNLFRKFHQTLNIYSNIRYRLDEQSYLLFLIRSPCIEMIGICNFIGRHISYSDIILDSSALVNCSKYVYKQQQSF